jgi:2-hydroxy-6-oxonona-2,4-dienedioate hydrolase
MDREGLRRQVDEIDRRSAVVRTRCGTGTMPFRRWNKGGGEMVLLLHGGAGSWTHWIRNIEALSAHFDVIVPDLPGLGESASLPDGYQAEDAADWTGRGVAEVIGDAPCHMIGFSWGCTVLSLIASTRLPKSILLVGPAAIGDMPRRLHMQPLLKRAPGMTDVEVEATQRENLARLMIHDRNRIDDLAVMLQVDNVSRSRFNSPQFARSTLVLDSLATVTAPLSVVYGAFDAPAFPDFETRHQRLRSVRQDLTFAVIPEGGHWLQYELADRFNELAIDWLGRHGVT